MNEGSRNRHLSSRWQTLIRKYGNLNAVLIDQAIVSGVNFITGIMLARVLGLETFGQFSLIWIFVMLISNLQSALILFPMMSIAPKIEQTEKRTYLGNVFLQQVLFSIVTAAILGFSLYVSSSFMPDWKISDLALPGMILVLTLQIQEFLRRYFFVVERAELAMVNDAVSYLGQLFCLAGLTYFGSLSLESALWGISGSSLLAIITGLLFCRFGAFNSRIFYETVRRHWESGSWLILSNLTQWGGSQGLILMAGYFLGASSVGGIRAVINLAAPVNILMQGLQNLIPVKSSQVLASGGKPAMVQYLKRSTIMVIMTLSFINMVTIYFAEPLMMLLYGKEYLKFSPLIILQALYILLGGLVFPLSFYFRALEQTRAYAMAMLMAAPVAFLVTYATIHQYHAGAVFTGLIVNQLVIVSSSLLFIYWPLSAKNMVKVEEAE